MRYCKNDVINLQACEVCNGFVGRRFDANYILLRIYNRYLILEANDEKGLAQLLSLQMVFGDDCDFELHPIIDIRKALDEGLEEPSRLLAGLL